MAHLLLIDDDPALIQAQVEQAFPAPKHRVEVARTGADGLKRVTASPPTVILLDLRLPDQSGLEVYEQIRQIDARIPVIFVTMTKGADTAIEAMRQGAYDYLFKPIDLNQLRRAVGEALEVSRRMREPAVVAEDAPDSDVEGAIIGNCPAMREVYKAIGRVADQDVPVLITGESGTGKSELALELITRGHRLVADDAPEFTLIAPDVIDGACPELLQDLLEVRGLGVLNIREMFGHTAVKPSKYLRLVVHLKPLTSGEDIDGMTRLTGDVSRRNVLDVDVPKITIPVAPGRNLAVLVEAAVRNHVLKSKGIDPAQTFIDRQAHQMRRLPPW
jgi:CheY-like chemotaxis protein